MPKVKAIAMARGTLYVDENLKDLVPVLSSKNIHVRVPPDGMPDKQIAHDLLTSRIMVTNNSKDFVPYASSYDIGIIGTESVTKDPEILADMVSDAIVRFELWSKRHGFILKLRTNGRHLFKELTT